MKILPIQIPKSQCITHHNPDNEDKNSKNSDFFDFPNISYHNPKNPFTCILHLFMLQLLLFIQISTSKELASKNTSNHFSH